MRLDNKDVANIGREMVGLGRLELPTSRLSGVRSNQAELQAHFGSHLQIESGRHLPLSAFTIEGIR